MASAPVVRVAPVVSHSETSPAEKISDSEVAVEDVIKQYEFMQLASEPSERPFIWPEGTRPEIPHNEYDFDVPLIDLTPVLRLQSLRREIEELKGDADEVRAARSGLEAQMKDCEAAKSDAEKTIRAACEEYGFFEIINSGFPMEVVEYFGKCCRQMFDLPLEAWTNGRFLSAQHQVVANEKSSRMSIAVGAYSYNNGVVSPRPECVDVEHPLRYKPFTAAEYFEAIFEHGLGRDTVRGEVLDKVFGI
ncbi:unnamed protein product [Calypogeia fissa]